MKVTRYPQSCLVLEKDSKRLLIDPGDDFAAKYTTDDLGKIDGVVYTHSHSDHYVPEVAQQLRQSQVPLFGNQDVVNKFGEGMTQVNDGEAFEVAGFKLMPHDLPHCLLPDGSEGPQNTGFLIDGTFFDPGDGIELEGLEVRDLALPIVGPDISYKDAVSFAKQLGAQTVIPIHYDKFGGNPELFATFAERFKFPFKVIVLASGESTEL